MNLVERLHKTGLYDRRRSLVKLAEAKLNPFNDIGSYLVLRATLDRYLAANSLYDRRYALRNLDRLNCLLVLCQFAQMGRCNERDWAAALRSDHIERGGNPPQRRQLDNPALAPR